MGWLIDFLLSFSRTYQSFAISIKHNIRARISEHKVSIYKLEILMYNCETDQERFDYGMQIKREEHHIEELERQLKEI